MAKFRKRPVVVEAEQFHQSGNPEDWSPGIKWEAVAGCYYVVTAHGQHAYLADGDWIIAEPDGRGYYPCKPDIFAATYEPAGEGT